MSELQSNGARITIVEPDWSEIDAARAERYGRQDYWNAQGWREQLASNIGYGDGEWWLENHCKNVREKFFEALREKAPTLFAGETVTIPMLKKYEQAVKDAVLSVGCCPSIVRFVEWWPVKISKGAERYFDVFAFHLKDEYAGPEWLPLPRRRPIQESMPELFGDNAITFESDRQLSRYIWEHAGR